MRAWIGWIVAMTALTGCTLNLTSADKTFEIDVALDGCKSTVISPDLSGLDGTVDQMPEQTAGTQVDPKAVGDGVGSTAGAILEKVIK